MDSISSTFVSLQTSWHALRVLHGGTQLFALVAAVGIACGFEFINGFHDTANAVATVIYTRSLRPWLAVTMSGIFNFAGVLLGGTAVAMGIIKLLPTELLITHNVAVSLAMVFALLVAAMAWNLGTWYFGLPASSSHTLIGSILGIGIANAYASGQSLSHSVNWTTAADIGLALLISPLIGFLASAFLLWASRHLFKDPVFHSPPPAGESPPWGIRSILLLTSGGVSFAHGSNDGQKGIGLMMVILIALFQGQFALRPSISPAEFNGALAATQKMEKILYQSQVRTLGSADDALLQNIRDVETQLNINKEAGSLTNDERLGLRQNILTLDRSIGKLVSSPNATISLDDRREINDTRKMLRALTDYAPTWVVALVAFSIGLGTMIGWKRVVVTLGEKIGKGHLTYAQGASAQFVAMGTIGISAVAGLPVSTTHVLSSGIAGTMVAGKVGLQPKTITSIILAWLLTLPASILLSSTLFLLFLRFI